MNTATTPKTWWLVRVFINTTVHLSSSICVCRAQLRDPEVVAALVQQNVKMARLLPPTGTDVFRPLTLESLAEIDRRMAEEAAEQERMKEQNVKVAEEDLPKPTSDLEAGKVLPFIYGDPPPNLLNVPIEELDPFYKAQKVSGKSSTHLHVQSI